MIIIITTTGIILAGLIYLLCAPVYFEIGYDIDQRTFENCFIRLYPFTYRIKSKHRRNMESDRQSDHEKNKTKRKNKLRINYIQLIRNDLTTLRQLAFNSVKFVQGIVISPDYYLDITLTGGFTEPHITGWCYGGVCAIQPVLGKSIRLFYEPDFTSESLNGKVRGHLSVRLYNIIREISIFLWRLPKLRLFKIYFKSKNGGSYGESTD